MVGEKDIQQKLAKLEALFARGATAGERSAAGAARDRLHARLALESGGKREAETELRYSLPDVWSVRIFVALCRKHDIKPYRIPGNDARQSWSGCINRASRAQSERNSVHFIRNSPHISATWLSI